MRRLGGELGVEAMSLYRYFPSKAALFDAVVDSALGRIAPTDGRAPDWESAVRSYATSFRDFAREHPRLFPLLAAAGPSQRSVGALMDRMLEMWRRAGLDEAMSRNAQRAVHAFTIGQITAEIGVSFGPPDEGRDAWCQPSRDADPVGRVPRRRSSGTRLTTRSKAGEAAGRGDGAATTAASDRAASDAAFQFALDVLIDGLRDRFERRATPPATA
jgi:AcrR family transcriptional regulator